MRADKEVEKGPMFATNLGEHRTRNRLTIKTHKRAKVANVANPDRNSELLCRSPKGGRGAVAWGGTKKRTLGAVDLKAGPSGVFAPMRLILSNRREEEPQGGDELGFRALEREVINNSTTGNLRVASLEICVETLN